jgi:hypothetical protein
MRAPSRPRKPAQLQEQERVPNRQAAMLAAVVRLLTTVAQPGERDDRERPSRPQR